MIGPLEQAVISLVYIVAAPELKGCFTCIAPKLTVWSHYPTRYSLAILIEDKVVKNLPHVVWDGIGAHATAK